MGLYARPFRKEDLATFVPIEPMTKDEISDPELAQAIEDSGLAVTGIINGKVVGCGGVHPVNSEQGEIWLRLSRWCVDTWINRLRTLRWLKSGLKIIEETYPFKQLNAAIQCDCKNAKRLVEHFGFKATQVKDNFITYSKLVK